MRVTISLAMAAALVAVLPACKVQEQPADSNAPAATAAAASIDAVSGTWKVDLASIKMEGKPNEVLIKDGSYNCITCIPPLTVAADGAMHPVADRPYYDSMSVKIVDDSSIEVKRTKGGKDIGGFTQSVSADGKVLTTKWRDLTTPGQITEGTDISNRVGEAPAGAHAISGQWQPSQVAEYTEEARNITWTINGDSVTMNGSGQSYTAVLGGPAVAIKGDTGGTTVKVAREGASGLKETFIRDGKDIGTSVITPSADGKSVTILDTNLRNGRTTTLTANKV